MSVQTGIVQFADMNNRFSRCRVRVLGGSLLAEFVVDTEGFTGTKGDDVEVFAIGGLAQLVDELG